MAAPLPESDGDLVRLAVEGRQDAFSALYERYFQGVLDFLTRLLRNREEAADVAQDTFIKAFERINTLENADKFKSWLFTIAHRSGLNRIRSSKRTAPGFAAAVDDDERATMAIADADPSIDPEQVAAIQEAADIVWEAAAGLDPRTYTVMDLHIRQGLDSAEIADVMGVTKGNAYTMVSRMKQSFSNTLATYLLVRRGRSDCPNLALVIPSDVEKMTPQLRKAADRHVNKCDRCAENRVLYLAPVKLFAALLMVPVPAGLKASIWGSVVAAGAGATAGAASSSGSSPTPPPPPSPGPLATVTSFVSAQAPIIGGIAASVALVLGGLFFVGGNEASQSGDVTAAAAVSAAQGTNPNATLVPGPDAPVLVSEDTTPTSVEPASVTTTPGATVPPPTSPPPTSPPPTSPPPTSPPPTSPPPTSPPPTSPPPPPPLVVSDDGAVVDEDTTVIVPVLANDTGDIDPESVLVSAAPGNGVAAVTAGQVSYTPDADFFGTDELSYSVATTDGQAASGRITVSVLPVNDVPVVPGPSDPSVDEDGVLTFDPLAGAVDVDGDTLVMSDFDGVSAAGGTIAEGSIIYTPPADFNGSDTFSYTVSDGSSETVITVEVAVAPVPDPPRPPASGKNLSIDEDVATTIDLLAGWSDPDGDTLSVAAGTFDTAAGGSLVVAADGTAVYTPAANYFGADSFNYEVSDGSLRSSLTAGISIAAVPDAPVAPDDDIVIDGVEDEATFGTVLSGWTDPEGDAISALPATATTDAGGSVTIEADGSVTYTPPADFNGEDGFDYEVSDGIDSTIAHAVIDVAPVNDEPEAEDASFDVDEDAAIGTVLGVVTATDVDGDELTFTPDGDTVAIDAAGTVSVVGEIDFETASTIVLQSAADDGNGGSAAFAVTIAVNDVDEAPEVDDATFTVDTEMDEGDVIGTVTAVDPEGDAVTFSILDDTDDVEIGAASGVLTMGDEYSDDFPTSITVQVTDPSGLTATATVTFDVVDVTDPEIADLATSEVSIFAPTPAGLTCTDGAVLAVITATVSDEHGVIESATLSWVAAPDDDDDDDDDDGDDDGDDDDDDDDDTDPIVGEVPVEIVGGQLTGVFSWGEALDVDSLNVDFTLTVTDDSGNTASQSGLTITVERCGGDDDD